MKVDFAPLASTVTYDRQVLSPSCSCPLKNFTQPSSSDLQGHPQMCFSSLAGPTRCSPIIPPLCLPDLPGRKKTYLLYVCCKSPQLTLSFTSMHTHNHIYTEPCVVTHTCTHTYTASERNTSGEPVKIWVGQQEQGVWVCTQTDVLCWPSVIMDHK